MGWINRLCIKQLLRALPIARERMRLAREHAAELGDRADLSDYAKRRQRVLDLECSLRARIMVEYDQQNQTHP